MPNHFKLLFRGKALEGHAAETVRHKLGQALKLDDNGLEQLFSGRLITLKRGLGQAEATRYQGLLEQLGAEILLQPDADSTAPSIDGGESGQHRAAAPVTKPDGDALGDIVCPRCAHCQPVAPQCAHCRMDMRLHLKRLQRKAKVLQLRSMRAASG